MLERGRRIWWLALRNSAGVMKGLFTIDGKKYYLRTERHHEKTGWQRIGSRTTIARTAPMRTSWLGAGKHLLSAFRWFDGFRVRKLKSYSTSFGRCRQMTELWKLAGIRFRCILLFPDLAVQPVKAGSILVDTGTIRPASYYADRSFKCTGKTYYFGSINDGSMKAGWQQVMEDIITSVQVTDGAAKISWQYIGGYWYYFNQRE